MSGIPFNAAESLGRKIKVCEWRQGRIAPLLGIVLRLALGGVFVWSSIPKLRFPYEFLDAVYAYDILGTNGGMILAIVLPWLELMVGVLLLSGIALGGALLTSTLLFTMFLFAECSALYRDLTIGCACFTADTDNATITYWTLVRTGGLLVVSMIWYALVVGTNPRPSSR